MKQTIKKTETKSEEASEEERQVGDPIRDQPSRFNRHNELRSVKQDIRWFKRHPAENQRSRPPSARERRELGEDIIEVFVLRLDDGVYATVPLHVSELPKCSLRKEVSIHRIRV